MLITTANCQRVRTLTPIQRAKVADLAKGLRNIPVPSLTPSERVQAIRANLRSFIRSISA
jgi:hypothetical protein